MKALKVTTLTCGLLLAMTACGAQATSHKATAPATPHTVTINGSLTLSGSGDFSWDLVDGGPEAVCYGGDGGYSDIKPGASVVVTNESGTTIAVGALGSATATYSGKGANATGESCDFTFTIPDVPDAKFYGVQVSHRGVVQFSPAELGSVALTLGN